MRVKLRSNEFEIFDERRVYFLRGHRIYIPTLSLLQASGRPLGRMSREIHPKRWESAR